MSNQEIITICQQLHSEGKTPSVALIKSRLSGPVSMPIIISAIKSWKNNPKQQVTDTLTRPKENHPTLEDRVAKLEDQVNDLLKVIDSLNRK